MQSKLTISVDKNIIEQAKVLAKKKGRSLSDMIENYLKLLVSNATEEANISPEIKKLQGSVKLPTDFDYKQSLREALGKKHGK